MGTNHKINDRLKWKELDEKIQEGLKKTTEKLIIDEKSKNGYFVIADKDGSVKKIPASEL